MEITVVFSRAFLAINENRKALLSHLWLPVLFILFLEYVDQQLDSILFSIIIYFLSILVSTIFAITIHRIVILGKNSISDSSGFNWSQRETLFAIHLVALTVLLMGILMFNIIPFFGAIISLLLLGWVLMRLSLVFPGIAIDKGISFSRSWDMTKQYQLLMFIVIIVIPAAFSFLIRYLLKIPHIEIPLLLLSYLALVFEIALLSASYQLISGSYFGGSFKY